jgi:hypothetical protein
VATTNPYPHQQIREMRAVYGLGASPGILWLRKFGTLNMPLEEEIVAARELLSDNEFSRLMYDGWGATQERVTARVVEAGAS